jgi:hypothetical protein
MASKKILSFVLFTALILLLVSCFKEPELKQVKSVKLRSYNNDTVLSDVVVLVKNPIFFNLKLSELSLSVFIDDSLIGIGRVNEQDIVLKKEKLTPIPLKFKFEIADFLEQLEKHQEKLNKIPVKTIIKGRLPYLGITISYNLTQRIDFDSLIKAVINNDIINVKLKKVEIIKVNVNNSKIRVLAAVETSLPISVNIKRIVTKVYNDKSKSILLGKSQNLYDLNISHGIVKDLILDTEVNTFNSAVAIFSKFLKKDQSFYIQSNITIDLTGKEFTLPFESLIKVNA